MWVSFPISRRSRVIIPWFIAIPLIPVAVGVWVLGLTVDAMRWAWRSTHRKSRRSSGDSARIRVTVR